ncbi:DUF2079 domain-containing protein [Flexivirga sp. ID2601S]|uniref:DUF2079 domain-containing protein n=1 Tax=Flexivirga aerilata TaxID=1656889 RepID=A0A849AB34_9MICO|nr:DUF2079 domain-containing protein [Flexivirga aerilata]NNG37709.1 DUF2079 domain-containing protein [Flexivirga aerilata]
MIRSSSSPSRRSAVGLGVGVAAVAAVFYTLLAIGRWRAGNSANYDLGIFAQGADAWSRGQWPESHIRGLSLLGDHFSPLLASWGALWHFWPTPPTLLITQAVLLAAALGVIVAYTRRVAGLRVALLVAVVGLLSRAVLTTAMFDVHEVAYAAIALAVLCIALLQHRFGWAVAASVWLLLTKEDMGLTVFAAGACWWWMHRGDGWRRPLVLAGLGVAGVIVAMLVLGAFAPGSGTGYLAYFGIGSSNKLPVPEDHSLSPQRLLPVLMYVVTALGIGVRSKLTVLAIPTLLWRAASSNIHYWALDFHYDLVLWPIGLLAFVDVCRKGLPRLRSRSGVVVSIATVASLVLGVAELQQRAVTPASTFRTAPVVRDIRALAGERLPKGAKVATQMDVGPYLVPRYDVYSLRPDQRPRVDYVMFTDKERWTYQVPVCARERLVAAGAQVWRRGIVTLVKLPSAQVVTPTC